MDSNFLLLELTSRFDDSTMPITLCSNTTALSRGQNILALSRLRSIKSYKCYLCKLYCHLTTMYCSLYGILQPNVVCISQTIRFISINEGIPCFNGQHPEANGVYTWVWSTFILSLEYFSSISGVYTPHDYLWSTFLVSLGCSLLHLNTMLVVS